MEMVTVGVKLMGIGEGMEEATRLLEGDAGPLAMVLGKQCTTMEDIEEGSTPSKRQQVSMLPLLLGESLIFTQVFLPLTGCLDKATTL